MKKILKILKGLKLKIGLENKPSLPEMSSLRDKTKTINNS